MLAVTLILIVQVAPAATCPYWTVTESVPAAATVTGVGRAPPVQVLTTEGAVEIIRPVGKVLVNVIKSALLPLALLSMV